MKGNMTLTELQKIIRDSLYIALPDMYWVIAEISEIKENYAGHCYLELVEKNPENKNVKARVKAIIWSKRYRFLKSFFENTTGESLKEGIKILIKIKVEYHELFGLSLIVTDIDPAFTIGDMAMKRQVIITRLKQDGVFSMNKELDFPAIPRRIAIISSRNAAGYSDFIKQLTGNSYKYTFYTKLIESAMQGADTEQGIISAMDEVAENIDLFDLLVIIRGGGSQSDLSWFDNYDIAYHVTQFPLPVITGIGHDKDISVTDMVASKSFKTPTAVADFLIECMVSAEQHINEMSSAIKDVSRVIIQKNRNLIEAYSIRIIPAAQLLISDIRNKLSGNIMEIINVGKGYIIRAGLVPANQESRLVSMTKSYSSIKKAEIERNKENLTILTLNSIKKRTDRLKGLENTLNILSPKSVLKRGYTITSLNGKIVKKRNLLKTDDIIDTQFSDGSVCSRVVKSRE